MKRILLRTLWAGALSGLSLLPLPGARLALAAKPPPKAKILTHIRETFAIPRKVPMALTDLQPSGLPGLQKGTLTIGEGPQAQKNPVHFSQDGKHYFLGEPQDVTLDPDGDRRSKMRLEGSPSKGPASAPVTVVEWSDFQCPHCRRAHLYLKEEWPKLGDRARFVFKVFPLAHIHPWAEPAAVAAWCAFRQKPEAFWTLADAFFEDQEKITKETLREKALALAAVAGLEAAAFSGCLDRQETLSEVRREMEEGERAGVSATPTIYVNGHSFRQMGEPGALKDLVDEMAAGKHP